MGTGKEIGPANSRDHGGRLPRRIEPWGIALLIALVSWWFPAEESAGKDFTVSPSGAASGDGSKERPFDLGTALSEAKGAIRPGDTICLLGGTYKGAFECTLKGTRDAPITIRGLPGERVTIDCQPPEGTDKACHFSVLGQWTVFRDFEVTCTGKKRGTTLTGSHPEEINRGGVNCLGANVKFINLVVHDTSQGFGFWSNGEGGEIYGCIIYNNGWDAPDRGHGHAIYTQNKTGTKRLVDNIMFNQFSYGVHAYGSSAAFINSFHLEGNVSFNNGAAKSADSRTVNILVGGGSPSENITVVGNFTYATGHGGTSLLLGYGAQNKDAVVKDNYFVGPASVRRWGKLTLTGNTFISPGAVLSLELPKEGGLGQYEMDKNTYVRMTGGAKPFGLIENKQDRGGDFAQWQKDTQLDKSSTFQSVAPTGVKVFVRANQYEPGRANVIVYNWDRKDSVEVDLKDSLKPGAKYRVVSAQDFFGPAVAEGTYDGRPVRLPMKDYRAPSPIGKEDYQPPATGPEFNVFVVVPVK